MNSTAAYRPSPELAGHDAGNDPFHDPVILAIGIAVIVVTLVMAVTGGIYYWGAVYDVPSWSNHSFPPPAVY